MTVTVHFKTLTQSTFTLDLDENSTVLEAKSKIFEKYGEDYAPELQKLIYNGKILLDETKISEAGFENNKFVVVMLARKKTADPAPAAATTSEEAKPEMVEKPVETPKAAAAPAAPAPVAAPAVAPAPAPDAGLTNEQEQSVESLTAMGYVRSQVVAALRAAFWNPERAVEFLITGLPAEADLVDVMGAGPVIEEDDDVAVDDIHALENAPQFNEIRALLQQNPDMLATVLQQLAAVNPDLLRAIQNNQQAFMDMLNAPVSQGGQRLGGAAGAGGGAAAAPPGSHVIELTRAEMDAIDRIKSMGFRVPDRMIVEAYLACEKNEEAAVDYILNNMGDEEE